MTQAEAECIARIIGAAGVEELNKHTALLGWRFVACDDDKVRVQESVVHRKLRPRRKLQGWE